jgi:hypothetical protein
MQGGALTTYVLLADFVASEADETGGVARTRSCGVGIVKGPDLLLGSRERALTCTRYRRMRVCQAKGPGSMHDIAMRSWATLSLLLMAPGTFQVHTSKTASWYRV